MRLLIDIGNSRIKWALATNEHAFIRSGWSLYEDIEVFTQDLANIEAEQVPEQCLIVSVGQELIYKEIAQIVEAQWSLPVKRFETQPRQAGVINAYNDASALGADRWAALIATHHLFDTTMLIADCGSAVTLDVLHANGVHQGGYIMPGLQMMRSALHQSAQLPLVTGDHDLKIANNTHDAIAKGSKLNIVAAIERTAQKYASTADKPLHIVLTGGDAEQISNNLAIPFSHIPDLVLKGLAFSTDDES